MINQLDHSNNMLHMELLLLKKTLASANDELMLNDKAVS